VGVISASTSAWTMIPMTVLSTLSTVFDRFSPPVEKSGRGEMMPDQELLTDLMINVRT